MEFRRNTKLESCLFIQEFLRRIIFICMRALLLVFTSMGYILVNSIITRQTSHSITFTNKFTPMVEVAEGLSVAQDMLDLLQIKEIQ